MSRYTFKVKNKYLVFIALFSLIAIGWVRATGGDYLFNKAEEARQKEDYVNALAYYDKYIAQYPGHEKIPVALFWSADMLPNVGTFQATFFARHSSISTSTQIKDLPKGSMTAVDRWLRLYNEFPEHWSKQTVALRLGQTFRRQGDPRAEEFLVRAFKEIGSAAAGMELIDLYVDTGRYEAAMDVVCQMKQAFPSFMAVEVQLKTGDIYRAQGHIERAKQAYLDAERVYEEASRHWFSEEDDERVRRQTQEYYQEEIAARVRALASPATPLTTVHVVGRVTLLGSPLPGVEVLVQTRDSMSSQSQRTPRYSTTTKEDGSFTLALPVSAEMEVGIRLDAALADQVAGTHLQIVNGDVPALEGKEHITEFHFVPPVTVYSPKGGQPYDGERLEIRWAPYPGAAYYSVSLDSVQYYSDGYSITGGENIKTQETALVITQPPRERFGGFGGDQVGVLPETLIGALKAADAVIPTVRAHDEDGRIISASGGLYFASGVNPVLLLKTEGVRRTQAEALLLERKYDEAMQLLEGRLAENPTDVEALDLLARMYFGGTTAVAGSEGIEYAYRDLARSAALLERLVKLEPTAYNMDALSTVYRISGRYEELTELYRRMVAEDLASWNAYHWLGHMALRANDVSAALSHYQKGSQIAEEPYPFYPLLGLYLVTDQIDRAIQLVQSKGSHAINRVGLVQALKDYAQSPWPTRAVDDYWSESCMSWEETKLYWQRNPSAHREFLRLIADLSDEQYQRNRQELSVRVQEFVDRYSGEHVLANFIRLLARERWI